MTTLLAGARIPELGPSLGKLITGTGRDPGGLSLDRIRVELVTTIIDATGEARRLASAGESVTAMAAVGPPVWQSAWESATAAVADLLIERVERQLLAEARAVRMPRRLRRRYEFTSAGRRGLASRLGARGAMLVPALDALAQHAAAVGRELPDAASAWQDALVLTGRRLEAAWLELEDAVDQEIGQWRSVADSIAAWRRSLWPVAVGGLLGTGIAVWLGLVFAGYAESPAWLTAAWERVFPR